MRSMIVIVAAGLVCAGVVGLAGWTASAAVPPPPPGVPTGAEEPVPPGIPTGPTTPTASGGGPGDVAIQRELLEFNVFAANVKVGTMALNITTVRDVMIIDEDWRLDYKGKELDALSQITYSGAGKPMAQRAKATTFYGDKKLMEGTATFAPKEGGFTAKEDITGYADKDIKLFLKEQTVKREADVPGSIILTHASFLRLAPQLLPMSGQMAKVTMMRLPADYGFPGFTQYLGDCVLVRTPPTEEGRSEYQLKQMFVGGNFQIRATLTVDHEGKIVKSEYLRADGSGYVFLPVKADPVKTPTATKGK
jgi:hypothetical protein